MGAEIPQPASNIRPEEARSSTELDFVDVEGKRAPIIAPEYINHLAELESREQQHSRKFGHTVLADGFAVQGLRVPGRNEVVTAQGVLRTRTTPRSSNS